MKIILIVITVLGCTNYSLSAPTDINKCGNIIYVNAAPDLSNNTSNQTDISNQTHYNTPNVYVDIKDQCDLDSEGLCHFQSDIQEAVEILKFLKTYFSENEEADTQNEEVDTQNEEVDKQDEEVDNQNEEVDDQNEETGKKKRSILSKFEPNTISNEKPEIAKVKVFSKKRNARNAVQKIDEHFITNESNLLNVHCENVERSNEINHDLIEDKSSRKKSIYDFYLPSPDVSFEKNLFRLFDDKLNDEQLLELIKNVKNLKHSGNEQVQQITESNNEDNVSFFKSTDLSTIESTVSTTEIIPKSNELTESTTRYTNIDNLSTETTERAIKSLTTKQDPTDTENLVKSSKEINILESKHLDPNTTTEDTTTEFEDRTTEFKLDKKTTEFKTDATTMEFKIDATTELKIDTTTELIQSSTSTSINKNDFVTDIYGSIDNFNVKSLHPIVAKQDSKETQTQNNVEAIEQNTTEFFISPETEINPLLTSIITESTAQEINSSSTDTSKFSTSTITSLPESPALDSAIPKSEISIPLRNEFAITDISKLDTTKKSRRSRNDKWRPDKHDKKKNHSKRSCRKYKKC